MIIEYNLIHKDFDYMIDRIASFFRIEIGSSAREKFKTEFDSAQMYEGIKDVSFGEWDKGTQLHESHISSNLGMPGKGQRLTIKQREIARSVLELSQTLDQNCVGCGSGYAVIG